MYTYNKNDKTYTFSSDELDIDSIIASGDDKNTNNLENQEDNEENEQKRPKKIEVINGGNEKHNTIKAFLEELGQNSGMGCDLYGHYIFQQDDGSGVCLVCDDKFDFGTIAGLLGNSGDDKYEPVLGNNSNNGYCLIDGIHFTYALTNDPWNRCYYNPSKWEGEHFYYTVSGVIECPTCHGSGIQSISEETDKESIFHFSKKRYKIFGCTECDGSGNIRVKRYNVHAQQGGDNNLVLGNGYTDFTATKENFYQGKPETCNDVSHVFGEPEKEFMGYYYIKAKEGSNGTDSTNYATKLLIPVYKYTYKCNCGKESVEYTIKEGKTVYTYCVNGHTSIENFGETRQRCRDCGYVFGYDLSSWLMWDKMNELVGKLNDGTGEKQLAEKIADYKAEEASLGTWFRHSSSNSSCTEDQWSGNWSITLNNRDNYYKEYKEITW